MKEQGSRFQVGRRWAAFLAAPLLAGLAVPVAAADVLADLQTSFEFESMAR